MEEIVGRDIKTSLQWLNIVRQDPLWSRLPKDLIRMVLEWFVFSVSWCWCGRFQRSDIMMTRCHDGIERLICSDLCHSAYSRRMTALFGLMPSGLRYVEVVYGRFLPKSCIRCNLRMDGGLYWVEGRDRDVYCNACFDKFKNNGLILEKKWRVFV